MGMGSEIPRNRDTLKIIVRCRKGAQVDRKLRGSRDEAVSDQVRRIVLRNMVQNVSSSKV